MSIKYKVGDLNGLHFLTMTVVKWIDLFTRQSYRDLLIDSFKYCCEKKGLVVYAYVIMPNHLHCIVSTKPPFSLTEVIRDFKRHTARNLLAMLANEPESRKDWLLYLFKNHAAQHKPLQEYQIWQHENHPIELWSPEVTEQKLQYIHNNPVRAGWVQLPQEWRYSSASNYCNMEGLLEVELLTFYH